MREARKKAHRLRGLVALESLSHSTTTDAKSPVEKEREGSHTQIGWGKSAFFLNSPENLYNISTASCSGIYQVLKNIRVFPAHQRRV